MAVTRVRALLVLLVLALAAGPVRAEPRLPDRAPVVDDAKVISAEKLQLLVDAMTGFERTQQRRVAVVTVPDLEGYAIDDFGHRLGRRWGLGESGLDDGAILIVAPNDSQAWIEVGDGVKSVLPESAVRNIIDTQVLPSLRQGDMDTAILNGAGTILGYLELPHEQAAAIAEQARLDQARAQEGDRIPWGGLAILIALILLWPIVRRIFGGLWGKAGSIVLLGGGGSSGGGFGGFGGGGGGFTGGGASGRW